MAKNAISYIKNVGKSVAFTTMDVVKDMVPVYQNFVDTNGDTTKSIYKSVKNLRKNAMQIPNKIMESPYGKFGKTYLSNLTSDLKSGNFYNKERIKKYDDNAANQFMGINDDLDSDFGSFDETPDFDNLDSWDNEPSTNEMIDIVGEKTSNAISNTMARSSEYIVQGIGESNRAIYNQMNMAYAGIQSSMSTINENIAKMVEFSSEATVTHYENARVFFEESAKLDQERNDYLKDILENVKKLNTESKSTEPNYRKNTYSDLVNSYGVLDLSAYFKNIKGNLNNRTGGAGDMISMAVEMGMLNTFASSPISSMISTIIKDTMPSILKESFKNFNDSLSSIAGNLFLKLKEKGSSWGIWNTISEIFGIDSSLKTSLNTSNYEKGKIPFDGITKKAIVEVIPTYLSKILSAVSGDKETRYNYEYGKFVTTDELRKEFNNLTKNSANSAASNLDHIVNNAMYDIQNKSPKWSKDDQRQFEEDWNAIKQYMYNNQKTFNTRDKNLNGESFGLKGGIASDVNVKLLQEILDGNSAILKYADEMFKARDYQNRQMANWESSDPTMASLFNGSIASPNKKEVNTKSIIDNTNRSSLSELIAIHKELSYIRIYGIGGRTSGSSAGVSSGGVILPDGIKPSFNNFEIPDIKIRKGNDKEYDKKNEKNTTGKFSNVYNTSVDERVTEILKSTDFKNKNDKKENKSFSERMHEAATLSAKMSIIASSATELAKKPAKFIVSVLDKADERLYDLIYGTKEDKEGNKSFAGKLFKGLEDMFNKFSDFLQKNILDPLKNKFTKENIHDAAKRFFGMFGIDLDDTVKKAKEYLFGKKDDNGRHKGGLFGSFINDFKDAMHGAVDWVKNAFKSTADWAGVSSKKSKKGTEKDERNKNRDDKIKNATDIFNSIKNATATATEAATGIKKVNKTGLAVISEGEAIIPPDMNPFNIAKRRKNEKQVKKNLIDSINSATEYAEGTPYASDKDKKAAERQKRIFAKNPEYYEKFVEFQKSKKEKYTKEDYEEGRDPFINRIGDEISKGFKSVFDSIQNSLGIDEDHREENNEKFKKSATDYIAKFKEYSGSMAAGGAIGAGVSVITGAIGGPLLGAAVGAGLGLIKKSETVQKMLFGDLGEDGKRTGGIVPKELTNKVDKYFGDMSKGATVGGILSMLPFVPGGPVSGIILGSAIGFAKNNDKVQNMIFGEGKLLGKKEDFQNKIRRVLPKMGAGALAGLLAGPFGLTTNILLGSALGFATDTNKFKDLVFGEVDEETGKREGGIMQAITKPAVDFFQKMYGEFKNFLLKDMLQPIANAIDPIKQQFKIIGRSLMGVFKDTFKMHIGRPVSRLIKEKLIDPISKRISPIFSALMKPIKWVVSRPSALIGGVGDILRTHQIKTGQASYSTAGQRNAFRESKGWKTKLVPGFDKYADLDKSIANMSDENVDKAANALQAIVGSKKDLTSIQNKAAAKLRKELYSDKNGINSDLARTALDMVRNGSYSQAQKLIENAKGIDPAAKKRVLSVIESETEKIKTAEGMKNNREETVRNLSTQFKGLGLNFSPEMIEKMAKGDKEVLKQAEMLTNESELRKKFNQGPTQKSPVEQMNADEQKRHEEIVDKIDEIINLFKEQLDKAKSKANPNTQSHTSENGSNVGENTSKPTDDTNTEDEIQDETLNEEEPEYYTPGRLAKNLIKKGIKGVIKAPFKTIGAGVKAGIGTAKLAYKGASQLRHTKLAETILGDKNTDYQNDISNSGIVKLIDNVDQKIGKITGVTRNKIPEEMQEDTSVFTDMKNIAKNAGKTVENKLSSGANYIRPYLSEKNQDRLDKSIEFAKETKSKIGEFAGTAKETSADIFHDMSNSIKSVAGNISAMAYKEGIDTTNIDDKSNSKNYLNKIKNKFKNGMSTVTQFVDGLPLKFVRDKNGDLVEDTGNAENKDTHKSIEKKNNVQKGILAGITGLTGTVTGFFGKLFGKKEKKGIFSKILEWLTGGKGLISKFTGAFSSLFSGLLPKLISGITSAGGVLLKTAIPLILLKLAKNDKFNEIVSAITGGAYGKPGTNDKITVEDENGERHVVKTDENGDPVMYNNMYETEDGKFISADNNTHANGSLANMSFYERLKYNTVRGVVTGKGSIIGKKFKSTPLGKLATKGLDKAKNLGTKIIESGKALDSATDPSVAMTIALNVQDNVKKWASKLSKSKIPFISKIGDKLDDVSIKIANTVVDNLPKTGAKLAKISSALAKVNFIIAAASIVIDFTTGYQDASTTLKIKEEDVTTGHRVACGLLRTIKNFVPIIGTFIPDSLIANLLVDYVLPIFGYDKAEFKEKQAAAQEELDEYNANNNTDYNWYEYNKLIKGNYTWTEKIGNAYKEKGILGAAGQTVKEVGKGAIGGVKAVGKGIVNGAKFVGGKVIDGAKFVGGKVVDGAQYVIDNAGNIVSTVGNAIGSGISAVANFGGKYNPLSILIYAGNVVKDTVKEIKSGKEEKSKNLVIKDDDPYGDIKKSIYNIIKILSVIPSALGNIGNYIWNKALKPFGEGVKTVGSGLKTTVTNQISKAWDGKLIEAFTDTSGDAHTDIPVVNAISKAINTITKVLLFPETMIANVVGHLVDGFKSFIEGAKTVGSGLKDTVTGQLGKAWDGKLIEAFKDTSGDVDTDNNVINSVSKAVNTVSKVLLFPATMLANVIGHVVHGFSGFVEGAKTVGNGVLKSTTSMITSAISGDNPIDELFSDKNDADTGNSLVDGISKAVNFGIKLPLTPVALITSAVSNVVQKLVSFFKTVAKAGTLSTKDNNIIKDAKEGKINPFSSKYWALHTDLDGVAGGFNKFISLMNKVLNLPMTLLSYLNPVKLIKQGTNWIADKLGIDDSETKDTGSGSFITTTHTASSGSDFGGSGRSFGSGSYIGRGSGSTFISQVDSKYKNKSFNISGDTQRQTIGDSGCAPAAAAMAINATAGGSTTSMEEASKNALRYKEKNDGVNANYFEDEFARHGMGAEYITSDSGNKNQGIMNNLVRNNKVVLMGQDKNNTSKENSPFGPNPHYVTATGTSRDGKYIFINDPESKTPNKKYDANKILNSSQIGIAAKATGRGIKYGAISKYNKYKANRFGKGSKAFSNSKLAKYIGRAAYGEDTVQYRVWVRLVGAGFSEEAAAGAMGNIEAESGFSPNNLENQFESRLGYNDEQYTAAIDSGKISREEFMEPAGIHCGYGLCQWTWPSRKGGLYDYAKEKGVSISDVDMQLDYLIGECQAQDGGCNGHASKILGNYGNGYSRDMFFNAKTPEDACDVFYHAFEGPPASDTTGETRKQNARKWYDTFKGTPGVTGSSGSVTKVGSSGDSSSTSSSGSDGDSYETATTPLGKMLGIFNDLAAAYGLKSKSSSSSTSTTGSTSGYPDSEGMVSSNASIAEKQKAVVNKARSIEGTLQYDMYGPRDPDQGSADCSSFVNWAYKKTVGVDVGGYTGSQTGAAGDTSTMYTVDEGSGGTEAVPDEKKLQLGDLLFYTRDYSANSPEYPMGIGHVGMYMGDGKEVHHPGGGGLGPKELELSQANRFRLAMRLKDFKSDGSKSSSSVLAVNGDENTDENSSENSMTSVYKSLFGGIGGLPGKGSNLQDPNTFPTEAKAVRKEENKFKKKLKSTLKNQFVGRGSYSVPYNLGLTHIQNTVSTPDDDNTQVDQREVEQNKRVVSNYNNIRKNIGKGSNIETPEIDIKPVKLNTHSSANKEQYVGRASKTSNTSLNNAVMIQLVRSIVKLLNKVVTNTDQLNNITKLLGEYITAKSSENGTDQSKQKTVLAKQNLITALQSNNSNEPDQDIMKLIEATEKIARE